MKFSLVHKLFCAAITSVVLGLMAPCSQAAMLVTSVINDSILRYDDKTGKFIDTLVPTGSGGLDGPSGMIIGSDGLLYVISIQTDSILRYNAQTGAFIDTFITDKELDFVEDLAFGIDGNLYLSNYSSNQSRNKVVRYDGKTGAKIDDFVAPGSGGIFGAIGIDFGYDNNLYVGNIFDGKILRYNGQTGGLIDTFITGNKGDRFADFTFAADGNLYIANTGTNNSVSRYNGTTGEFVDTFVTSGSGGLNRPVEPKFGLDGELYVTSFATDSILRYNAKTGAFRNVFVPAGSGGLDGPTSIVFVKDIPEPTSIVAILAFTFVSGLNMRHWKHKFRK